MPLTRSRSCSLEENHPCDTNTGLVEDDDLATIVTCNQRKKRKTTSTFHEFRQATIAKHANLSWLGPASMAVYWYKTYLRELNWFQCGKCRKRTRHRSSKGHFYHIPGQYLHNCQAEDVLTHGTPGVHYATSYIGVYNLVRSHGVFGRDSKGEIVLVDYQGPALPLVDEDEDDDNDSL